MVLGGAIVFILVTWSVFFFSWNAANHELNLGTYIQPHYRQATYWCAENCLYVPSVITIITIVIGVLILIGGYYQDKERERRLDAERRQHQERHNRESLDSTDFERELRRKLRDME